MFAHSAMSYFARCRTVSSEVPLENCTQVWCGPNLDSVQLMPEENSRFTPVMTYPNPPEPVRTCPQYSDYVRSSHSHFLHFRMLLFFGITSYPAEIAYFTLPHRELSKSVWFLALCLSKIVDLSISACLKTTDWRSFELGNFLVLRSVVLKMHISA